MGELVEFPRKPLEGDDVPRRGDGTLLRECDSHVHVFASIPGRCQCGSNQWPDGDVPNEQYVGVVPQPELTRHVQGELGDPDMVVTYEFRPILLSPEKPPERKWPEDFRGFGSNVRPKRS